MDYIDLSVLKLDEKDNNKRYAGNITGIPLIINYSKVKKLAIIYLNNTFL